MIRGGNGNWTLECDVCGEHGGGTFGSYGNAIEWKKDPVNHWCSRRIDGEWYDVCPACKRDLARERDQ